MRVLQVNKLYNAVGGIETAVRSTARGLASRGHDSQVLAAVERGRGYPQTDGDVSIRTVGSFGTIQSTPMAPTFPIRLHQEVGDADIVHHHLPNPLGPPSHLIALRGRHPTVCTYHSDIVRQSTAFQFYRPVLERFLDRVDRILATSPVLLEESSVLAPYKSKCEVVPLGIDLTSVDRTATYPDDLPDEPLILFVGRLNYYKGLEYLIDAMTSVDAHLLVAGEGPRREELLHQVENRNLTDSITFLGYVPDPALEGLYEAADVFVLPSVEPSEAFGIVQLEAMAHGLPVINTDLPTGVPWVSRDGETGITVPPRDADALSDAIKWIFRHDEQRRVLGMAARERVEAEFTRGQMLDRLETIYEDVLE